MPRYVFWNHDRDGTQERLVPIAERDNQVCEICGEPLERKMNVFSGSVWSPTRNGGMS